ncbi:MAG: DUF4153 domain-containing protein, partial [Bacteroidota bacterium]
RNYHYIDYHGLAYKRIGVIFFLLLTLFGLVTLWLKIRNKRTFFHVVRVNAWATYGVLLVLALVNWDMVIARHNIAHTKDKVIDVPFLLDLSDKVLPILDENREIFANYPGYERRLDDRIRRFRRHKAKLSWLSWNAADAAAAQYFDQKAKFQPPTKAR